MSSLLSVGGNIEKYEQNWIQELRIPKGVRSKTADVFWQAADCRSQRQIHRTGRTSKSQSRLFQICFIFIPIFGEMIEISQTDFSDGLKATTRIVHWFQDAFTLQKTNMYPTVGKGKESTQKCGLGGDIFPARYRNWLGVATYFVSCNSFQTTSKTTSGFPFETWGWFLSGIPFPNGLHFRGVVLVGFNNLENRSTFDEPV